MLPLQVVTDFAYQAVAADLLEHRLIPSLFDLTPPPSRQVSSEIEDDFSEPDPPATTRFKERPQPIPKKKAAGDSDVVMSDVGGASSQSVRPKKRVAKTATVVVDMGKIVGSGKTATTTQGAVAGRSVEGKTGGGSSKRSLGRATGRSDGPAKRPKVALSPDIVVTGSVLGDPPTIDLSGLSFKEGDAVDMGQVPLVVGKVGIVFRPLLHRGLRCFLQVCDRCAGKTRMSPCTAEWDLKHGKPVVSCNLCINGSQACSFSSKHWGINTWPSVRKMTPEERAARKALSVSRAPAIAARSISEGGMSSSPAPSSFQPPVAVDEGSQIVGSSFGEKGKEVAPRVSSSGHAFHVFLPDLQDFELMLSDSTKTVVGLQQTLGSLEGVRKRYHMELSLAQDMAAQHDGIVNSLIAKYQKEIDRLNLESPETGERDRGFDRESEEVEEAVRAVAESSLADREEGGITPVGRR